VIRVAEFESNQSGIETASGNLALEPQSEFESNQSGIETAGKKSFAQFFVLV